MTITNSAGVEVELKLNEKHYKNIPAGLNGFLTVQFSKGFTSKLEAVAASTSAPLLLNEQQSLVVDAANKPKSISITNPNGNIVVYMQC